MIKGYKICQISLKNKIITTKKNYEKINDNQTAYYFPSPLPWRHLSLQSRSILPPLATAALALAPRRSIFRATTTALTLALAPPHTCLRFDLFWGGWILVLWSLKSDSTVSVRSEENSLSVVRWHGIRRNGQQWCGSFSRLRFLLNFWDEFGLGLGLVFGVVL